MPARAIDHINIRAPKALVVELKNFYETVLGLRPGWRPPFAVTGHWLYLGETPVVHLVDAASVDRARQGRGPVVDHVAFSCTGLHETEAALKAKQIAFRRSEVPSTSLVQLFLVDPAGNGVELQFDGNEA